MNKSSYYHYSKDQLTKNKIKYGKSLDFDFNKTKFCPSVSPKGFWISTSSELERKMIMDDQDIHVNYIYKINITEDANLLTINNLDELIRFSLIFASTSDLNRNGYIFSINYAQVAKEYDGILIPNYLSKVKFYPPTMWYYLGWAFGGGCIFNLDCIEKISRKEKILA